MALERLGVPTATLVTDAFAVYAHGLAKMQGVETLPTIVIEHPVAAKPPDELRRRVEGVYQALRDALVARG